MINIIIISILQTDWVKVKLMLYCLHKVKLFCQNKQHIYK